MKKIVIVIVAVVVLAISFLVLMGSVRESISTENVTINSDILQNITVEVDLGLLRVRSDPMMEYGPFKEPWPPTMLTSLAFFLGSPDEVKNYQVIKFSGAISSFYKDEIAKAIAGKRECNFTPPVSSGFLAGFEVYYFNCQQPQA